MTATSPAGRPPLKPGLVIAVDGPSGSGKSTAARRTAAILGLRYLDTGAMYRALAWWLLHQGVNLSDSAAVAERLDEPVIGVTPDPEAPGITVDGTDVAGPIRTREVSNTVSVVAAMPQVRQLLIAQQREIIAEAVAARTGIVAEGRDIGTVVAPDAAVKVYLTAAAQTRAQRRSAELTTDPDATVATIEREQARRDQRDAAQLAMARDAVPIDTTKLGLDEVVAQIVRMAREHSGGSGGRPPGQRGGGSGGRPPGQHRAAVSHG